MQEMREFLQSTRGKLTAALLAVLLVLALGAGAYGIYRAQQPKFHDVTVELGTADIGIEQFLTRWASVKKASFVTDVGTVDISRAGSTPITLRHGGKEQTVTLTVVDTTPPQARFLREYTLRADETPDPNALVEDCSDLGGTLVSFAQPILVPADYSDLTVTVVVADGSGNTVSAPCTLSFEWLREAVEWELGEVLTKDALLYNPARDGALLAQADIDAVNAGGIGVYTVAGVGTVKAAACTVTVRDTTPPALSLGDVSCTLGEQVEAADFVLSCFDASGEAAVRFAQTPDFTVQGEQTVTIEAEDAYGNITSLTARLLISEDALSPVIGGLYAMTVDKGASPDYLSGVYAWDELDGWCSVFYDASAVDLTKAGIYYVSYTASDTAGNVAYARRRVEVRHDAADTEAMIARIAQSVGSDPEALRDYVRSTIAYSTDWGGDDPVWYGYTVQYGNCYVHAQCLDALLKYYGYNTQLIWVTEKTHYWLLIELDGVWRHIDPTPSTIHSRYSLMTDAQRLETLSGRTWDTSLWPACT